MSPLHARILFLPHVTATCPGTVRNTEHTPEHWNATPVNPLNQQMKASRKQSGVELSATGLPLMRASKILTDFTLGELSNKPSSADQQHSSLHFRSLYIFHGILNAWHLTSPTNPFLFFFSLCSKCISFFSKFLNHFLKQNCLTFQ